MLGNFEHKKYPQTQQLDIVIQKGFNPQFFDLLFYVITTRITMSNSYLFRSGELRCRGAFFSMNWQVLKSLQKKYDYLNVSIGIICITLIYFLLNCPLRLLHELSLLIHNSILMIMNLLHPQLSGKYFNANRDLQILIIDLILQQIL